MKIRVGDIFRDKDPRSSGRHVKVLAVEGRFARCANCDAYGNETGKRTRISLAGLAQKFERVGGSTLQADLERIALDALKAWRVAELTCAELLKVPRECRATAWNDKYLDAIERDAAALAALRDAADALGGEE